MSNVRVLILEPDQQILNQLTTQLLEINTFELCSNVNNFSLNTLNDLYVKQKPNIILVDVTLLSEDIRNFLLGLESDIAKGKVALIAISKVSDMNLIRTAMKLGCSDFLLIPINTDELSNAINTTYKKYISLMSETQKHYLGKIITVFSTKGGVGKSTISVNLAVMLSLILKNANRKVILLDSNFQFGDVGFMLNLKPEKNIYGLVCEMGDPPCSVPFDIVKNYIITHESGLNVLLAPSQPQYAEMITILHLGYIIDCLKQNYDYIIIDTVHSITEITLTIFDRMTILLILATLEITTIKNLVQTFEILKGLQLPPHEKILVLNRAFQKMGVEPSTIEEKLMKINCMIPSDGERVVASLNNGRPVVMGLDLEIPIVKAFYDLAHFIADNDDKKYFEKFTDNIKSKTNVLDFLKKLIKK